MEMLVVLTSVASKTICTAAEPVMASVREKFTGSVTAPKQLRRSMASRNARSS